MKSLVALFVSCENEKYVPIYVNMQSIFMYLPGWFSCTYISYFALNIYICKFVSLFTFHKCVNTCAK